MYNQSFIDDFSEDTYKSILNDKPKVKNNTIFEGKIIREQLKNEYFKQYQYGSDASALAFKESLDHYVLKQIILDKNYIKSKEFRNYLNYIMQLADGKIIKLNGKNIKPEFCTNIIFRNKYIRTQILKEYYPERFITQFDNYVEDTKNEINIILNKMYNREKITQEELDFISDYIYSSRNFKNKAGRIFAEYLFNEIKPNMNIKASTQILGAITSYFTQCYIKDEEVKNARTFVTTFDYGKQDIAHFSGRKNYAYFSSKYFEKISLTSSNSINLSRTSYDNPEEADIYHLMMIAFHELTHGHQDLELKRGKNSSSAMAKIVRNILNQNMLGYTTCEYLVNHDSTEFEMQADEEGWKQCRHFIADHKRQYAYKHHLDTKEILELEKKCTINEGAIRARRAFSLKKEANGELVYYSLYDIRNIKNIIKEKPKLIDKYPILKKYFDESGKMDVSIIFNENITTTDSTGLHVNNSNLEFATYIFDYEKNEILKKISSKQLTENQINNLMMNIYNVMHQNVLKIRDFDKLSIEEKNNKKTHHKFDLQNRSDEIYNYFFEKTAMEVYAALKVLHCINKNYPNINMKKIDDTRYYTSYFTELLPKTRNLNMAKLRLIYNKYNESGIPVLMDLANYMKEEYIDTFSLK